MKDLTKKYRNWAFILYPDSAPIDWREFLMMTGLSIAISPIHDSDFNDDGSHKKDHYHIIVSYEGPTTFNSVKASFSVPLNATIPIPLFRVNAYFRYLTHTDHPEKSQYSENDIVMMNGFDNPTVLGLNKTEIIEIKRKLCNIIKKNNLIEYSTFVDYLFENGFDSGYLDIALNNTYFFNSYIKSIRTIYYKTIE